MLGVKETRHFSLFSKPMLFPSKVQLINWEGTFHVSEVRVIKTLHVSKEKSQDSSRFHLFFIWWFNTCSDIDFPISAHFVALSAMILTFSLFARTTITLSLMLKVIISFNFQHIRLKVIDEAASFLPKAQCLVIHSSLLSHSHSLAWISKHFWDAVFQGTWSTCLSTRNPRSFLSSLRGSQHLSYVVCELHNTEPD